MKNLLLIFIVILISCSSKDESNKPLAMEEAFINNSQTNVRGYVSEATKELSEIESELYNSERDKVPRMGIYGEIKEWKEADKVVRSYIREYNDNPYAWDKVHHYTVLMLDKYLNQEPLNDEVVKATEFYVDLIVGYNTYETQVLGISLQRLQGHWSNEKISKIAEFGLKQREKYIEEAATSKFKNQELVEIQKISESLLKRLK